MVPFPVAGGFQLCFLGNSVPSLSWACLWTASTNLDTSSTLLFYLLHWFIWETLHTQYEIHCQAAGLSAQGFLRNMVGQDGRWQGVKPLSLSLYILKKIKLRFCGEENPFTFYSSHILYTGLDEYSCWDLQAILTCTLANLIWRQLQPGFQGEDLTPTTDPHPAVCI